MDKDGSDKDAPIKDTGSFSMGHVADEDIAAHHTDRWQNHAMYVGLHFPSSHSSGHSSGHNKRKHKRKHKNRSSDRHQHSPPEDGAAAAAAASTSKPQDDDSSSDALASGSKRGATPPSQRVQFILGQDDDGDDSHTPHDVFCEMEELREFGEDGELEWKETARWIKFEEDVEEGGERWSKPHVATLALHSLFELRKGIMSGTVMLDVNANNLLEITDMVLEKMVATKQLEEEYKEEVQQVLLSRHRHQHQKPKGITGIRSLADIGKKGSARTLESKEGSVPNTPSTPTSAGEKRLGDSSLPDGMKPSSSSHLLGKKASGLNLDHQDSNGGISETPSTHRDTLAPVADSGVPIVREASSPKIPRHGSQFNEHFLKKIPLGAEASNILVGEVEFLSHPIIAFLRLNRAIMLGDLTEVPVPTRFIFILLGPKGQQQRYHEIGRSIATLMSDEVFHEIAYKAKNRGDLLSGIDEFLDQVIVLPPGEWDPSIRIEPPKSVPSQAGRKKAPTEGQNSGLPNGMALKEEEEESHADPTLERTGRLFGGLIADIRRKVPWYLSDLKDALHVQCVASFFFMYFACLTPIITFGGLLGAATDNNIAAMESLMSGAICGISYHLLAGQPLTIIGSTGPVLVFETIVFNFCKDYGLNYLSLRFWIGLWICLILLIMVAFDLSALVRYITRFTEESFASLIALIFIVEAFKKLFHILDHDPINLHPEETLTYECYCGPKNTSDQNYTFPFTEPFPVDTNHHHFPSRFVHYETPNYANMSSNQTSQLEHILPIDCRNIDGVLSGPGCETTHYVADVFFFSCLLFLFTFVIAMFLKNFRNSRYFPAKVRSIISDFAVMIAISLMVLIDYLVGLHTPKLEVPSIVRPTRLDRGWIINPFLNPWWIAFAAVLPALLGTILIFMDQQITAVIVNRKENKLRKGGGYHLDLMLVAIQIGICSLVGTPWFVAATVLSINHVRSLTRESECAAPGERPKFLGVREQRVTGLLVFIMVGMSAFLSAVLQFIPMPVLYGVFLFMGVSSMTGVQLMQRVMIMLMPAKYQPDYIFLRHVPVRRVHIFTVIQIICLACLWAIKTIKSISIVFPLMVLAMCFVRKGLDWVFTHHELKWLDDIMPESHKREKEEKSKMTVDPEEEVIEMKVGAVNIPLNDGQTIQLPVDGKLVYDPAVGQVNISEEMSRTAIWKQLANQQNPQQPAPTMGMYEMRKRPGKSTPEEEPHNQSGPVKFRIADDDETECLMGTPEIRVDPPSKANSPDGSRKNNGPHAV